MKLIAAPMAVTGIALAVFALPGQDPPFSSWFVSAKEPVVVFWGTGQMASGSATVTFAASDWSQVNAAKPVHCLVTPTENGKLYWWVDAATRKLEVRETSAGSAASTQFNWMLTGRPNE